MKAYNKHEGRGGSMWQQQITYTYMNENEIEHTERKPRLGARKPNTWVSMAMPSKDNRDAREVTETFRYRQHKGVRYCFYVVYLK